MKLRRAEEDFLCDVKVCEEAQILWDQFWKMPMSLAEHCIRIGAAVDVLMNGCQGFEECSCSIGFTAVWHDIGKSIIPQNILSKRMPLLQAEERILRSHVDFGVVILRELLLPVHEDNPRNTIANIMIDVVQNHHERWDGNGYPNKKQGEEIPCLAQVVALANEVDVMYNNKLYKERKSRRAINREMDRSRGGQFSPLIIDLFMEKSSDVYDVLCASKTELQTNFHNEFVKVFSA